MRRLVAPSSPIQTSGACPAAGRAWQRTLLLTLMLSTLGAAHVLAQSAARLAPPPWPAELGEAFKLYYAEEFLEVQRVCRRLRAGTRDPHLRREAGALAAMATMRLPGRDNQINGRGQLAQLAAEDASLLTRPECQLAYGIAQTALNETATALHHLNQAAETFARRGQSDRLGETLVALSRAWARHAEWELTIPGMEIPRPENRSQADRIRRRNIRALRERAAALPEHEAYLPRIDLVLAEYLLTTQDDADEGLTLLEELTRRPETAPTTAQACLTLAERYEAARRWTDAARLYARVHAGGLGELSRRAEQRLDAIQRPQLILDAPRQVGVGQRVTVKLSVHNLAAVEFEVRRVDLADWLQARQGRFAEAVLPTSGALVAVRNLRTAAAREHDWWNEQALKESLTFEAPAGAVVVLARATDRAGRPVTSKRLVLAGDLRATVFTGARRAAIWATRDPRLPGAAGEAQLQAQFWMYGSFVPTRPRFNDSVAIFALPPEARLLRDKRWVCLVQDGEHVALCHGTLPAGELPGRPAVALIGGPPEARVGERLHVFGRLIGGRSGPLPDQPAQTVELQVLNALDRVLSSTTVAVSSAGTFSAHLPVEPAMADEHLHLTVRLGGRVLENVYSHPSAHVARLDAAPLHVHCHLPRWLPPTSAGVVGQVEALYPWGTPVSEGFVRTRARAVRLPTVEPRGAPAYSHAIGGKLWLDPDGKGDFVLPLADFDLPDRPLAVGLWVDATGWDHRIRQCSAELLIGPEPVHMWLSREGETPRVGQPLHTSVGWFDPTGRAAGARPTVAVWRGEVPVGHLGLLPAFGGLRSQTWRPTAPGPHELVATLPLNDGGSLVVRDKFHVEKRDAANDQDLTPLRFDARFVKHKGRPHVQVRLDGRRRHPVLALVEGGDPVAGRQVPSFDGPTDVLLPLPGLPSTSMRLVLAASDREGVQVLGATEVQPAAEDALALALSSDPNELAPGATVEVSATCLRARQPATDATLMARLVDASRSGTVQWVEGEGRADLTLLPGGIQVVCSAAMTAGADASGAGPNLIPETRELSAQLAQALFEGPTLWVDSQPSRDEPVTFAVPVPTAPGFYRLVVVAQTPDGAFASESLDLDTRGGIQLTAEVPDQLTVGDRSVASLTVTNNESAPTLGRITFDGGPGLHADDLRLLGRQNGLEPADDGASFVLSLAPFSTAILHASVEAARPGTGMAAFVMEAERHRRRATASYEIHAVAPAIATPDEASADTMLVHRTLFVLKEEAVVEEDAFDQGGVPFDQPKDWLRFEVGPDERIPPGQLVLVQEEFSLNRPLRQVEWEQRLPGNCHTHAGDWSDLRQIGTLRELRLGAFTLSSASLAAGPRHIHEYVIVPVRPGACQFPPPVVRAAGAEVRVEVTAAAKRVLVAESK